VEVLVGQATAGAGGDFDSDLAGATHLATLAVTALGLDPETGLRWSGMPTAVTLPEMLRQDPDLAARVRQVLDVAYAEALDLIRRHAVAVEALAAALLDRRALDGAEAAAIVAQHAAPAPEQS
jgi:cell division protease FtsH